MISNSSGVKDEVFCNILAGINCLPISCKYAQIVQYSVKLLSQCKRSQILQTKLAYVLRVFSRKHIKATQYI